jgi:hypothetical protein
MKRESSILVPRKNIEPALEMTVPSSYLFGFEQQGAPTLR